MARTLNLQRWETEVHLLRTEGTGFSGGSDDERYERADSGGGGDLEGVKTRTVRVTPPVASAGS